MVSSVDTVTGQLLPITNLLMSSNMKEVLFIWSLWFFRFYSFGYLLSTLLKVMPVDSNAGEGHKGMY